MTTMTMPKFLESPFFVGEPNNWHLLPGAPEEVVLEFEQWCKDYEEAQEFNPHRQEHLVGERRPKGGSSAGLLY